MRFIVPLVLMLGACGEPGPCPPRADVVVTDETGVSTGIVARIDAGLDSFYELTSRDALCLVEVRAVESISRQFLATNQGRYSVPRSGGVIELVPSGDVVEERVLRHELCHALDWTEGIQSAHESALLAQIPDGIEGLYEEEGTLWEAYARVCEWGPRPPVHRWLESSCSGLTFGTPGERVDERVTWSSAFDEPVGGGLSVEWSAIELEGPIQELWRAGDTVVVLESTPDAAQLRWIDSLDAPMTGISVGNTAEDLWVWPGSDRALLVANAPQQPHRLVFRSGEQESVDLGEAYGWGPGAVSGDRAAGLLIDPSTSAPLQHAFEINGEVLAAQAPDTDVIQAGTSGIEWSSTRSWVLTETPDGWTQSHHGVVSDGVDTSAGRLFRVEADASDGTSTPLLALLTPQGVLKTAGCEPIEGLPARLGALPVVVRAEGSTLHVGVVRIDAE